MRHALRPSAGQLPLRREVHSERQWKSQRVVNAGTVILLQMITSHETPFKRYTLLETNKKT